MTTSGPQAKYDGGSQYSLNRPITVQTAENSVEKFAKKYVLFYFTKNR